MTETHVYKVGEVRLSADQGSDRVSIAVAGRETTITAANAVDLLAKLRAAVLQARNVT